MMEYRLLMHGIGLLGVCYLIYWMIRIEYELRIKDKKDKQIADKQLGHYE